MSTFSYTENLSHNYSEIRARLRKTKKLEKEVKGVSGVSGVSEVVDDRISVTALFLSVHLQSTHARHAEPLMKDILNVACSYFGIDKATFLERCRVQRNVRRRQMVTYLNSELCPHKSLEEIGRFFGQHYKTVWYHMKAFRQLLARNRLLDIETQLLRKLVLIYVYGEIYNDN